MGSGSYSSESLSFTTFHRLNNVFNRIITPALNRCELCRKSEPEHKEVDHKYKRDESVPKWRGYHA